MAVPTSINDLSTTAGSNAPSGSDAPSQLDDVQRAHASFIAVLRDGLTQTNADLTAGLAAAAAAVQPVALGGTGSTTAAAARTALGSNTVGDAVFVAATQAAARQAIGLPGTGQLAGFRNLIINGNFNINQRGYVSGTATTVANQYTFDRWRVVTSGQSVTFSASGSGYQITAPAGGVEQVIEGANIGGGTYVVNWIGTGTCSVNGTARAKGDTFTLTANTSATVKLVGQISKFQIEPGEVVWSFEERPIGMELFLCQRYYSRQKFFIGSIYNTATNTNWAANVNFPTTMRVVPTVSVASGTATAGSSTPTTDTPSTTNARVVFVAGPATASAQADGILVADAEI